MSGKPKLPREWIFVISSAPALTGFFFSVFDAFLVFLFFKYLVLGRLRLTRESLSVFSIIISLVTMGFIFSDGPVDVVNYAQWVFFVCIMFFIYWIFYSNCLSESKSLFFWALGIIPNLVVAIVQQSYPGLDIFNSIEHKSNPMPGYDFIRASGLLYNPNSLAAYGIMCFIFFFFSNKYMLSVVSFFSVLITFSKMFFLLPVLALLRFVFGNKSLGLLIFSAIFLVLLIVGAEDIFWAFSNRFENANSFGSRVAVIGVMFSDLSTVKQVLLGVGPLMDSIDGLGRVHNKFLSIFFQFGVLGLIMFLAIGLYGVCLFFKSSLCYNEKFFILVFVLAWLITASVSTFTFFTYEYIAIVILLSAMSRNKALVTVCLRRAD